MSENRSPAAPGRKPWRRWLFTGWIVLTILVALWVAIAQPFFVAGAVDRGVVALVIPPAMALAVGLGIAWLAWFVSRPR